MSEVRLAADHLETVVTASFWPLPTYREMLFLK
jgi:glutamine synthetase type III